MHMEWWYWIVLGIVLLLAEALTPGGFYMLFIGLAAVMVGMLAPVIRIPWIEITLFAILSALFIGVLRKPLMKRIHKDTPKADLPEFVGETGRALEIIPADREGKVELRGSTWQAHNAGTTDLPAGAACVIIARDGLRLTVKPKHS